jgi:hypothetical protein
MVLEAFPAQILKDLIYLLLDQIFFTRILVENLSTSGTSTHTQKHPRNEARRGDGSHNHFRTIGNRFNPHPLLPQFLDRQDLILRLRNHLSHSPCLLQIPE